MRFGGKRAARQILSLARDWLVFTNSVAKTATKKLGHRQLQIFWYVKLESAHCAPLHGKKPSKNCRASVLGSPFIGLVTEVKKLNVEQIMLWDVYICTYQLTFTTVFYLAAQSFFVGNETVMHHNTGYSSHRFIRECKRMFQAYRLIAFK